MTALIPTRSLRSSILPGSTPTQSVLLPSRPLHLSDALRLILMKLPIAIIKLRHLHRIRHVSYVCPTSSSSSRSRQGSRRTCSFPLARDHHCVMPLHCSNTQSMAIHLSLQT